MSLDLKHLELLLGIPSTEDQVFADYLEHIANKTLLHYQHIFQHGNKRGESLYTHILNGICVLQTLQLIIQLSAEEKRLLFTAYTIHDINKTLDERKAFNQLAIPENVAAELERLGLPDFFEDWKDYLYDITTLIRRHSGHYGVGGEAVLVKKQDRFRLSMERLSALAHLMRAVDVIDLSKTLREYRHKETFLSHLNAYMADSDLPHQYEFHTHQLVEQRGLLSSVIHNAIMNILSEDEQLLPMLLYPDGVAYLAPKGYQFPLSEDLLIWLAGAVTKSLTRLTLGNPHQLIYKSKGIAKIKEEALGAGFSFANLWEALVAQSRAVFTTSQINEKLREKIGESSHEFSNTSDLSPALREIQRRIANQEPIIRATQAQLRSAVLIRAFYAFRSESYQKIKAGSARLQQELFELFQLPEDRYQVYNLVDVQSNWEYLLAEDIQFSEDEIYDLLLAEGNRIWEQLRIDGADPSALWQEYLARYLLINGRPVVSTSWTAHIVHYIENNHHQCAHCSSPFETNLWMAQDVRKDLKVQKFSNRLEGGSKSEPKKNICEICRIQFSLETLNYPKLTGEDVYYIHLFPYSFLLTPYLQGLYSTLNQWRGTDFALQALNMRVIDTIERSKESGIVLPNFSAQTKEGKPMPYGIYVPQYAETLSGMIIFPLNPPNKDSKGNKASELEQFLFALWNALVLQRALGMRVLLSKSPVPPLPSEEMPDLYLDMLPLASTGLLTDNAYFRFRDRGQQGGDLEMLWEHCQHLFTLAQLLFYKDDEKPRLVRAINQGPLQLYFEVDRLIEKNVKDDRKKAWLIRETLPYIEQLAISIGGQFMERLSNALKELAALAWEYGIHGYDHKYRRSPLLHPYKEVIEKMGLDGSHIDREAIIGITIQDIFDHLKRITDPKHKQPGATRFNGVSQWVNLWYELVLNGVYGGHVQKLLADEKLLRSAYLFYLQQQIPRKAGQTDDQNEEEE